MMMKRLLITGAAGALGGHCRQHVSHLAEIVRVSDRDTLGKAARMKRLCRLILRTGRR